MESGDEGDSLTTVHLNIEHDPNKSKLFNSILCRKNQTLKSDSSHIVNKLEMNKKADADVQDHLHLNNVERVDIVKCAENSLPSSSLTTITPIHNETLLSQDKSIQYDNSAYDCKHSKINSTTHEFEVKVTNLNINPKANVVDCVDAEDAENEDDMLEDPENAASFSNSINIFPVQKITTSYDKSEPLDTFTNNTSVHIDNTPVDLEGKISSVKTTSVVNFEGHVDVEVEEDVDMAECPKAKEDVELTGYVNSGSTLVDYSSWTAYVVDSHERALDMINQYEVDNGLKFIVWGKNRDFGKTNIYKDNHTVTWEKPKYNIHFSGIPFLIVSSVTYCCVFGKSKNVATEGKSEKSGGRFRKKLGCPAKIIMKEIVQLPDYKIEAKSDYYERLVASAIRDALKLKRPLGKLIRRMVLLISPKSMHSKHPVEQSRFLSLLHPDLLAYFNSLVWKEHIFDKVKIKEKLTIYCNDVLFRDKNPPADMNTRFIPSLVVLKNKIDTAVRNWDLQKSQLDQLNELVKEIKNCNDKHDQMFYEFDACDSAILKKILKHDVKTGDTSDSEDEFSSFRDRNHVLFCHQTHHQQRMLQRYGDKVLVKQMCFLQTEMPFPLMCLYTQTNVDWQFVGFFVILAYRKDMIMQGLAIIRNWNASWVPKFLICDEEKTIVDAVQQYFKDVPVFISDSSRQKEWHDWLSTPSNGVAEHEERITECLERMACSLAEDTRNPAARDLEKLTVWKENNSLRRWFQTKWLLNAKKWVEGYKPDDFLKPLVMKSEIDEIKKIDILKTNNFKKKMQLCDVIRHIFHVYIPKAKKQYMELNRRSYEHQTEFLRKNPDFPLYLRHLPAEMLSHISDSRIAAKTIKHQVHYVNPGHFTVTSPIDDGGLRCYTVSFGDSSTFPFCDCSDWQQFKIPCVHFCAVFRANSKWTWDMLPVLYKSNHYFGLDLYCTGKMVKNGCMVNNVESQTENEPCKDSATQTEMNTAVEAKRHTLGDAGGQKENDLSLSSNDILDSLIEQSICFLSQLKKVKLEYCDEQKIRKLKNHFQKCNTVLFSAKNYKHRMKPTQSSTSDFITQNLIKILPKPETTDNDDIMDRKIFDVFPTLGPNLHDLSSSETLAYDKLSAKIDVMSNPGINHYKKKYAALVKTAKDKKSLKKAKYQSKATSTSRFVKILPKKVAILPKSENTETMKVQAICPRLSNEIPSLDKLSSKTAAKTKPVNNYRKTRSAIKLQNTNDSLLDKSRLSSPQSSSSIVSKATLVHSNIEIKAQIKNPVLKEATPQTDFKIISSKRLHPSSCEKEIPECLKKVKISDTDVEVKTSHMQAEVTK